MLTRYQTLPSEPVVLRTANITCSRKSVRKSCITLITGALGSGVLRTGTEWTFSVPAAGKTDSIGVCDAGFRFFCGVVVVCVVVVVVVPVSVAPASARAGTTTATAAAKPAVARRADAIRARRLTGDAGSGHDVAA